MGHTVHYRCGECGFERGPVVVGRGDGARQMAPLGCVGCGDVLTVEVGTWRDETLGVHHGGPLWKFGDPCPACGGAPVLLSADPATGLHDCPRCGRRGLAVEEDCGSVGG